MTLPLLPRDFNGVTVHDPLSQYKISDSDDANDPQYYGYLSAIGYWYILKMTTADKTYRYTRGDGDYPTAWAARVSLGYDYFSIIF